jgi:3-hydroxyisobutyrate dehydrogenase-like beta-hydroxyacid dehydrogenase
MRIGFVGLGPMGVGMAKRLLEAGHELAVFNRTQARADALVEQGARRAGSPAEAARNAEIVLSMLANDDVVAELTLGPDGIAAGLPAGAVHLSCSTISVATSRRLAAAHNEAEQAYGVATVLGRPPAAASGQLFVMLAAAPEIRARVQPVLSAIGQRTFELGDDPARANLVKLSLNFLIFSTIEQMGEVFALNDKGGVPPALVFEIMTNSFFNAPVHRNYGRIIVEEAFDPAGVGMRLAAKDTALLLEAATQLQVPMPMGSLVRDRLLSAIAQGDAELDFAALSRRARIEAGLPPGRETDD